jgi:rhodanese-related sulfurtransferase
MGYTDVVNLAGGLGAWKTAKLPVEGWVDWATVWNEYLTTMPAGYNTIKPADLNAALVESAPFLLDVREVAEIEKDGYIAGAVNIPVRDVLNNLDKLPAKDQPIVIYCASGHRGGMIMASLQMLGYTNVKNLAGGLGGWKKAELAVEMGTLPAIPFILDVRTADEFKAGFITSAINVNINDVPANLAQLPADKAAPIVVLCQSGHRGAIVMMYLQMLGYTNVRNLGGGMNGWINSELPVNIAG